MGLHWAVANCSGRLKESKSCTLYLKTSGKRAAQTWALKTKSTVYRADKGVAITE